MAYTFNPTAQESSLLAQIAQRESSGNYVAQNTQSSASGAYQFINSTWQWVAQQTGVGTQYATAAAAPPAAQDANALWLLRNYGPNATISWGASGPYDATTAPLVDVSGDFANLSPDSLLQSVEGFLVDATGMPSIGGIVLGAGAALILYLLVTS